MPSLSVRTRSLAALAGLSVSFALFPLQSASAETRLPENAERIEEPARGRMEDGRAFRTDAEGNQLVDYIAELEVNIESLNRRIYGLQDEVDAKDRAIASLKKGINPDQLSERDLVKTASRIEPQVVVREVKASCPEIRCPELNCPAQPQLSCEAEVAQVIRESKQAVKDAQSDLEIERKVHEGEIVALQTQVRTLGTQVQGRTQELLALKTSLSSSEQEKRELANQASRVSDLQLKASSLEEKAVLVAKLEQELNARNGQISALKASLSEERGNIEDLRAQLASRNETRRINAEREANLASAREVAASESLLYQAKIPNLDRNSEAFTQAIPLPESRASFSQAKSRALDSIRGKLSTELNQIRRLVTSRDNLYGRYGGKKGGVEFKPSRVVSSRGLSLGDIGSQIKSASSMVQLTSLNQALLEIENRIQEDINLIKRMNKIS